MVENQILQKSYRSETKPNERVINLREMTRDLKISLNTAYMMYANNEHYDQLLKTAAKLAGFQNAKDNSWSNVKPMNMKFYS